MQVDAVRLSGAQRISATSFQSFALTTGSGTINAPPRLWTSISSVISSIRTPLGIGIASASKRISTGHFSAAKRDPRRQPELGEMQSTRRQTPPASRLERRRFRRLYLRLEYRLLLRVRPETHGPRSNAGANRTSPQTPSPPPESTKVASST